MANDLHTRTEPNLTELVTGIVNDAQELLKEQLVLFKQEIKDDVGKIKGAALSLGVGVGILAVGGLLLVLMVAHLLNLVLPLWLSYGIVGILCAACGGAFLYASKRGFESINPLLPDHSIGALKENVQWLLNPKK